MVRLVHSSSKANPNQGAWGKESGKRHLTGLGTTSMFDILIIDDDKALCESLCRHFSYLGYRATFVLGLDEGLKSVSSRKCDVVFLDVCLPDGDGLLALPKIQESPCKPEVVIITGEGDPDGAELAIQSGAWSYVEKPFSIKLITLHLTRALQYREEKSKRKPRTSLNLEGIVGESRAMKSRYELLAQAAGGLENVLITGETGTGKELFARAIHENSMRSDQSFVVVDCTVLPETLVESVLFGHRKGSFTGADRDRIGLVKQADGGTLFLDEVGELSLQAQKAFLRVLQERRFRPVGDRRELTSDFRLVAATNRDLGQMAQSGDFRKDLLFRLRGLAIELPPLRERPEDVESLIRYYVSRLCQRFGFGTKSICPDFLETLSSHSWPGNVRELITSLETAVSAARQDATLFAAHLPTYIRINTARRSVKKSCQPKPADMPADFPETLPTLKIYRKTAADRAEKDYLVKLLSITGKNIKKACRMSGLSRTRLWELQKKHGIAASG